MGVGRVTGSVNPSQLSSPKCKGYTRRMVRLGKAASSAAWLLLGVACGVTTAKPIPGPAPPVVLALRPASARAQEVCEADAKALCARALECSPLYVRFFFETIAQCEALVV